MTLVDGLGRQPCSLCGGLDLRLKYLGNERGVCSDCICRIVADAASVAARLQRYLGHAPEAADERHAGHVLPVPGCERCGGTGGRDD